MGFDPERPYNDLPDLPPATQLETVGVLKRCIDARAKLAELKQLADGMHDQAVLINTIPILEARASSEIENVVTTGDELFRIQQLGEGGADPAAREAYRYRTALRRGFDLLADRPLGTRVAVEVCSTITDVEMEVRRVPGTQVINTRTGKAIYTPPVGEQLLREKLSSWERFLHQAEELDPLIRMAAGHYQFEAIHPFTDGNGRTGRILNLLYLCEQDLLSRPVLYLSGYINRHRPDYYRLLLKVTAENDWEDWLLFMIDAVRSTAAWTIEKIRAIRLLQQKAEEFLRREVPDLYSYELLQVLFTQPYCRIGHLVDAGIVQRQQASVYLKRLTELRMLEEQKVGRAKLFVHRRYLELLLSDGNEVRGYG